MDPEEVKVVGKEENVFKILLQLGRILTNLVFSFVVYGARNLQPKKGAGEWKMVLQLAIFVRQLKY